MSDLLPQARLCRKPWRLGVEYSEGSLDPCAEPLPLRPAKDLYKEAKGQEVPGYPHVLIHVLMLPKYHDRGDEEFGDRD